MVNNDGTATICATAFDLRSALVDALARAEAAEAEAARLRGMFRVRLFDDGTYAVSVPHEYWPELLAILAGDRGAASAGEGGKPSDDEWRQPCPNGCLDAWGVGVNGQPVPAYCGVNGCDVESPGMSFK